MISYLWVFPCIQHDVGVTATSFCRCQQNSIMLPSLVPSGVPLHSAQQGMNAVSFRSPNRMASCCLLCLQVFPYVLHNRESVPFRFVAANRMASCCLLCLQVFPYVLHNRESVPFRSAAANRMASCCLACLQVFSYILHSREPVPFRSVVPTEWHHVVSHAFRCFLTFCTVGSQCRFIL